MKNGKAETPFLPAHSVAMAKHNESRCGLAAGTGGHKGLSGTTTRTGMDIGRAGKETATLGHNAGLADTYKLSAEELADLMMR
jgi:hypothetical protein